MKGSELSQQYLTRSYDVVQGNARRRLDSWLPKGVLRRQLAVTSTSVNDLLNAAISETEAAGTSLCNCEEVDIPARATAGVSPAER